MHTHLATTDGAIQVMQSRKGTEFTQRGTADRDVLEVVDELGHL